MLNKRWVIGALIFAGFFAGYLYTSLSVLKSLSADFLLGDYVYERAEPRVYFPVIRPVRDWYFMNKGKARVVEQMENDPLLAALPFTIYVDVTERFPEKRSRSITAIRETFCHLEEVKRVHTLNRIRDSGIGNFKEEVAGWCPQQSQ